MSPLALALFSLLPILLNPHPRAISIIIYKKRTRVGKKRRSLKKRRKERKKERKKKRFSAAKKAKPLGS
jgi:hypothetical protein